MLARPDVEGRRRDLIDQWNSKTEPGEVHTLDVILAGVARFDSNVVVFRGMKVSELRRSLFAAVCANDSPKFPR